MAGPNDYASLLCHDQCSAEFAACIWGEPPMSDVGNQPVCENCAGQKHTDMGTTLCHVCAGTGVYINPSSESLKDAIITAIRRHIRLEWHSHDHADINHRSLQAASEEVASLI